LETAADGIAFGAALKWQFFSRQSRLAALRADVKPGNLGGSRGAKLPVELTATGNGCNGGVGRPAEPADVGR